ncbi:MAG: YciK family oxidoreductase [Pseudomonadota bacterium]
MTNSPTPANLREFVPQPRSLRDKVVLVTGASDGIGRAVAVATAQAGALVLLLGRSEEKLNTVHDEIVSNGGPRPIVVPVDFMQADGGVYMRLTEQIKTDFTKLDGLVHCAGILGEMTEIEHYDAQTWQEVMHVNVTAGFALTKVLLPLLREARGRIIFTSSSVGRRGRAFWGAYAVSKFATEGLAQTLAEEQKPHGVTVNVINPGATRTAMRAQAYPMEVRDKLDGPETVAPAYLYFLCSEDESQTGLSVDVKDPK